MRHVDLFSGIGGFALAASWNGVETVAFAEIDAYCSAVLRKHWPNVTNYGDVRNVPAIDDVWLVTGGFPCQPFSVAGKRKGAADDRHLWPEMLAVIERVRPAWVLGENVPGIIGMELDRVLSDLEDAGFEAWACVVPACAVDAPHRRQRVWIVAHDERRGISFGRGDATARGNDEQSRRVRGNESPSSMVEAGSVVADNQHMRAIQPEGSIPDERGRPSNGCRWQPEPDVGRVANGIPKRVDRLKGLGNAIVPQVAAKFIGWMIEASTIAIPHSRPDFVVRD